MFEAVLSFIGLAFSVMVGWRISRSARNSGRRQADLDFAPKAWERIDMLDARLTKTQMTLRTTQSALEDASAELADLPTYYRDTTERLAAAGAFIDKLGQTLVDADVQLPLVPDFPEALHRIADSHVWHNIQDKEKL